MENSGVSNLIIVESENDKYFISHLINKWGIPNTEVNFFDYECLDGLSHFTEKIRDIKYDKYNRIGIIIDADNEGIEGRVGFVNQHFKALYNELSGDDVSINVNEVVIDRVNQLKHSNNLEVELALHVTNVSGHGELETLLKSIKSKESPYADCLNAWRLCLKEKDKSVDDKEFDKFWVSNYLRFDTCSSHDQKQAGRKCRGEYAIKKDIWNLDHQNLQEIRTFLNLFCS